MIETLLCEDGTCPPDLEQQLGITSSSEATCVMGLARQLLNRTPQHRVTCAASLCWLGEDQDDPDGTLTEGTRRVFEKTPDVSRASTLHRVF